MISSPYLSLHESPNGPEDGRPTALQVVKDQGLVDRLSGKVVLITGVTSGLGIETARALYTTGAKIYITGRNMDRAAKVARDLTVDPNRPVEVISMSLDSLASVRAAAQAFSEKSSLLNILICNAGVMACDESRTTDGFEYQFGTNHLGHFLFFQLLKDTMLKSSTPQFASRVVSVASSGHRNSSIHVGNYNLDAKDDSYDRWKAYAQSKTANIFFANEVERRYGAAGLHGLSLNPGLINTDLGRHISEDPAAAAIMSDDRIPSIMKSVEQGAATTVWAAVGKEWEGHGGKYLEDVQEALPIPDGDTFEFTHGYASHAYDEEAAKRLWEDSLRMVGISRD